MPKEPWKRIKTLYRGYGKHDDMGDFFLVEITHDDKDMGLKRGDHYIEQCGDVGMPGTEHYLMPASKEIAHFLTTLDWYSDNKEFSAIMHKVSKSWPDHDGSQTYELPLLTMDQFRKIHQQHIPDALPHMPWHKENRLSVAPKKHHKVHER